MAVKGAFFMENLLVLAGAVFVLCCFLGKPMQLAVRGVLGLIGSLILISLAVFGVSLLLSIITAFVLMFIVVSIFFRRIRR